MNIAIDPYLLHYRQMVAIKNQRSNRYLVNEAMKPVASAAHPFLQISDEPLESSNAVFQLLNAQNTEYAGPLILGTQVMLYNPSGCYMVCHAGGEIKFERMTALDAQSSRQTNFLVFDSANLLSKRQVTIYDDLVFKYNETNFMISELSMVVNWNGTIIAVDSCWKLQKAACPPMPDWLYLRPNISLSFLSPQTEAYLPSSTTNTNYLVKKEDRKTLGSHPQQVQSILLIEDLLYCMMGIEGTYIKKRLTTKECFEYAIEPNLDQPTCEVSLHQMVGKILPICQHHDEVEFYIVQKSKFDYGKVSQALCSALRVLMKEYITMVNQLDNEFNSGELTLQKLWYYLQPSIKVLQALHFLVQETQSLTGGALLSKIYDLINQNTDRQVISVYSFLIEKAFQPYIILLYRWLYFGEVEDTFGEFLVNEKKTLQKTQITQEYRDNYWETRFTLRTTQIPRFLDKHKEIILRTGKYLNVARESLKHKLHTDEHDLLNNREQLIHSQDFSLIIMKAFEFANKQIIELLFRKEDLLGRLRTIKRFFMMESGDFFIHFLELAEEELTKAPKMISKEKVESLLDMSVRSVSTNDAYKEDIIGYLDSYTIMEQIYALQNLKGNDLLNMEKGTVHSSGVSLKGIELFTIDLKVQWPLNLVLSRTSMVKYQIIFKSLFYFKYIERQLNNTWLLHQTVKELGLSRLFVRSHALLQRMLHFIKSYVSQQLHIQKLYYFCYEVIDQNFVQLEQKITQQDSFEEVLALHHKFIEVCLTQSLLLNAQFMKGLSKLTQCCLTFAKAMQRFTITLTRTDPNFTYLKEGLMEGEHFKSQLQRRKFQIEQSKLQVQQIITEQSYNNTVSSFTKTFEDNSKELLKILYQLLSSQHNYLIGLVTRLDFEGQHSGLFTFNQYQA